MNLKKTSFSRLVWEFLPFFIFSVFLFVCVFLIGHFKSYTISPTPDSSAGNGVLQSSATPANTENVPYITDVRFVAEHEKGIGVFDSSGELLETYTLDITRLPHADRQILKKGISFDSEGELRDFLESLDS